MYVVQAAAGEIESNTNATKRPNLTW